MVNILVHKDKTEWSEFEREEWKRVDEEHYGKPLTWEKVEYLLEARDEKVTIGTLRLVIREGVAYVDAIIVKDGERMKGVGNVLMGRAEEIAKDKKAHKIHLQTGKDWESVGFYERLGYVKTGNLPNHYHHVDFVEMAKFLEGR